MKKETVFLSVFILLFSGFLCSVYAESLTIDKDAFENILKRQESLEKKIDMLEKKSEQGKDNPAVSAADTKYLKEDVEEMGERLDKIETKSIVNRITIGGEYRVRMDSFAYDDYMNPLTGQKSDPKVDEIWSNRLRLNLKGKITENITFHGRLSYFKLWGDSTFPAAASDMTHPSIPDAEGNIHVEKAYIDYFVPGTPLSFTFGRLPSAEGPPNELKDNCTRKSTWPKLVIDGEADGIIANLSLDKWTGLNNSMFRLVYSKIFQNYSEYAGLDLSDSRAVVAAFEMEIPRIKDSMLWLSYAKISDLPALTQASIPASFPFVVASSPKDSGSLDLISLHLQLNNIKNTGLDWFGSFSNMKFSVGSEGTVFAAPPGYEVGLFCDNASGNMGKDRDGQAFYTGLRYKLPIESLKQPLIGLEYNHGSKYWTGLLSSGSGDLVNKMGINGNAYEIYYIQPISKNHMFLRVGAVYMDYDYYNPMLVYGSQEKSDMSILNFYCLASIRF